MQAQRDLLDQLMGASRNEKGDTAVHRENFKSEWVCKNYLLGLCPYDIFRNTRLDYGRGSCGSEHKYKDEFEAHPEHDRYARRYAPEMLRTLECIEVDRRAVVQREKISLVAKLEEQR